jgi:hypothetical protein
LSKILSIETQGSRFQENLARNRNHTGTSLADVFLAAARLRIAAV